MRRYLFSLIGLASAMLITLAATQAAEQRADSRTSVRSSKEVRRLSVVIGANVQLRGGSTIGRVEDIVLTDEGCVDYVIVAYENRYLPIPWVVVDADFGSRVIRVDIECSRLRDAVFVERDFRNLGDVTIRTRINTFFSVKSNKSELKTNQRTNERSRPSEQREVEKRATEKQPPKETPKEERKKGDTEKPAKPKNG